MYTPKGDALHSLSDYEGQTSATDSHDISETHGEIKASHAHQINRQNDVQSDCIDTMQPNVYTNGHWDRQNNKNNPS